MLNSTVVANCKWNYIFPGTMWQRIGFFCLSRMIIHPNWVWLTSVSTDIVFPVSLSSLISSAVDQFREWSFFTLSVMGICHPRGHLQLGMKFICQQWELILKNLHVGSCQPDGRQQLLKNSSKLVKFLCRGFELGEGCTSFTKWIVPCPLFLLSGIFSKKPKNSGDGHGGSDQEAAGCC